MRKEICVAALATVAMDTEVAAADPQKMGIRVGVLAVSESTNTVNFVHHPIMCVLLRMFQLLSSEYRPEEIEEVSCRFNHAKLPGGDTHADYKSD